MADHSLHLTETGLTVPVHCSCASIVHTARTSHPRLPAHPGNAMQLYHKEEHGLKGVQGQ